MNAAVWFRIGASGALLFVATVVVGGWLTPDYSHIADPVSALSQRGARFAVPVNAGFAIAALLQLGTGLGVIIHYGHQRRTWRWAGWLILIYAGLGALIAMAFPMDPIGADVTAAGVLHLVCVGLSALALLGAMILLSRLPGFTPLTLLALGGMVAGGVLAMVAAWRAWPVTGLGERVTQASYFVWLVLLSFRGARESRFMTGKGNPADTITGPPSR